MHAAFIDLFQAIHDRLDKIQDHEALAKAASDGTLALLEFWDAVHHTSLAPVYDKLRHAKLTALNAHFPDSLRSKGLADMKAIVAETLAELTKPAEPVDLVETEPKDAE